MKQEKDYLVDEGITNWITTKNRFIKIKSIIYSIIFHKFIRLPNFRVLGNKNLKYYFGYLDNLNKQNISRIISKLRARALPNPDHVFNAGSFFKNPIIHKNQINFEYFSEDKLIIWDYSDTLVKVGAARLIELIQHQLSLPKNVSIYKNHSLVLITNGKATQQEVLNFASHINEIVYKTFNISLEIEPNIIN